MNCNLKPANIVLLLEGIVKISDLGNATEMGQLPQLSMNICTRWYKSPELILGHEHYDQAIDLWSAGCIESGL